MRDISGSSDRIADILSVIDGIARILSRQSRGRER
jgi:methyl-accepting chemotaxis protein